MFSPIERNQETLVLVIGMLADTHTTTGILAMAPILWAWRATRDMTTMALVVAAILN